jgi:hypothetical protein
MTARDEAMMDLVDVGAQSAAFRLVRSLVDGTRAAAQRSRAVGTFREIAARFVKLPAARRVRLAGVALLAFSLTSALLTLIVPLRSAPAVPEATWLVAGATAVWLLASAERLATRSASKR